MPTRFRDDGSQPDVSWNHWLVRCPRCQGCAEVRHITQANRNYLGAVVHTLPARVVCRSCGYIHTVTEMAQSGSTLPRDDSRDWVSGLPFWLHSACAGHILWAWNASHLEFLERYVSADLRERTPNVNRSLASRLPRWLKAAKHRDEVLRCIRKLYATLPEWALAEAGAAGSSTEPTG